MKTTPLPGFVPTSQQALLTAPKEAQTKHQRPLRQDFASHLEQRLSGWIGEEGSERRAHLEPFVGPYLREDGSLDLEKLPESAKSDLARLQSAAEGIEAIFVKKLLTQMRSISFLPDKSGPMADLAKDLMDQAMAEQAARGGSTVGIAKLVFLDTAQTLVRSAVAANRGSQQGH